MLINTFQSNSVDRERWKDLLKQSKFASPFQAPEFFDFFNQNANTQANVFAVGDKEVYHALCVVIFQKEKGLKTFFSRRAIVYGGPVLSENISDRLFSLLLNRIISYYKDKAIYIEFRNLFDYSNYQNLFRKNMFNYLPYLNFEIPLDKDNSFFNRFKSEKRRQIRKSLKLGSSMVIASNKKDAETLYSILNNVHTKKAKKPLPDLIFFLSLFDLIHKNELGFYILIKNELDIIIGGSICLVYKNSIYDWYRGGLDNQYKYLYPSTMAAYAGMKIGADRGYKKFDFMGAGNKNEKYGVRSFKSQFGGKLVEHGRFIKVLNPFLYQIGKLGIKVLSKIK